MVFLLNNILKAAGKPSNGLLLVVAPSLKTRAIYQLEVQLCSGEWSSDLSLTP